jgi:hypothetical protein
MLRHLRPVRAFLRSSLIALLASMGLASFSASAGPIPYPDFVRALHALERIPRNSPFVFNYILPNEVNPALAKPILWRAPVGAYLTVGTERAFMSAAMDPNATYLFVADRDPSVILYNKINTALLKGSYRPNRSFHSMREDYVALRLEAAESEWRRALVDILPGEKITEYFTWWDKNIRKSKSPILREFHTPPIDQVGAVFHEANYLFDDELFAKIQTMAHEERIQNIVMDLGNPETFSGLSRLLADAGIPLAVFDISNAWYEQYIGPKTFSELLDILDRDGNLANDSLILLTDHHQRIKSYSHALPTKKPFFTTTVSLEAKAYHEEYDWSYHAYRKEYLRKHSKGEGIQIPKRSAVKVSSFDDVPTVPKAEERTGPWCVRLLRALGVLPR